MPDEKVVSPDEYIVVRGVPVRKDYIDYKQQEYGATLIPDKEALLLSYLDQTLREFRLRAISNKAPPNPKSNLFTAKEAFFFFAEIPVPLGIYIPKMPTVMSNRLPKPAWFIRPRQHRGVSLN
jgi:hypothetical protein